MRLDAKLVLRPSLPGIIQRAKSNMANFIPRSVSRKPVKKPCVASKIRREKYQASFLGSTSTHVDASSGCFTAEKEGNSGNTTVAVTRDIMDQNRIINTLQFEEKPCASTSALKCKDVNNHDDDDDDNVIYFSKNQRWPDTGDPICVVCSRYGEYICDQTEDDVCSKECKAKNLYNKKIKTVIPNAVDNVATKPAIIKTTPDTLSQTYQPYTYTQHWDVASLSESQIYELRQRMEINVKGDMTNERPIVKFSHCNMDEKLLENLTTVGYKTPTPVQMQVIPVVLRGSDVLACAQTGSGKTASFLVPMIMKIHHEQGNLPADSPTLSLPKGLVLAPTRELCMQIERQAKELMTGLTRMRTALIIGGLPLPNQLYRLEQGVQIMFATPGRLSELVEKTDVDFSEVKMLVIDEVDVLLQMGFEKQVQSILERIPTVRQTLLFSATIPPTVERLSKSLLTNPAWISVGAPSAPNMAVKQIVLWVDDRSKKKRLFSLLQDRKYFTPPILVFVDSKMGADLLAGAIQKTCDIRCISMHGDKVQSERTRILEAFLSKEYDVLVCTGVMGRGLDLQCVKQVINFDMPSSVDEYIHQVGRAGRLGSNGLAITFINNSNKGVFLDLVETIEPHGVKLPAELTNSPYLAEQQRARESAQKSRKRKNQEVYVNRDNLMDMLKKSTFRRRLKNQRT